MKVNEEIDALITMGFDPVTFLALPRVICGFFFVPMLTAIVNIFGMIGMFAVMLSMGYPFSTIYQQVTNFTTLTDMSGGLFKAFVFGFLVAGVGCLRGLETTTGSQAVGQSTTRAVVSGIVLVVIAEGIFSVIFYVLGI
jgi:phospholipid/cholesterol/gamma-HCH transport system permease protein